MKKLLLSFICLFAAMSMQASDNILGSLFVSVNGVESNQNSTVTIDTKADGSFDFILNNFILITGADKMPVGNIKIDGMKADANGNFAYNGNLLITPGNLAGYSEGDWAGPFLGEVPLELTGNYNPATKQVIVDIDINLEALGQIVKVQFTSYMDFTDELCVNVNGIDTKQQATVYLNYSRDGKFINFLLPNFCLGAGADVMPVGNIFIPGIATTGDNFAFKGNLNIPAGDMEGYTSDDWAGPMLGEVPLDLTGVVSNQAHRLFVTIGIDMQATLQQTINVQFGSSLEGIANVNAGATLQRAFGLDGRVATKGIVIEGGKKVIR